MSIERPRLSSVEVRILRRVGLGGSLMIDSFSSTPLLPTGVRVAEGIIGGTIFAAGAISGVRHLRRGEHLGEEE
jgi:hypothetical protein